jgi:hypothetical protein
MSPADYLIHGLHLRSEIAIPGACEVGSGAVDLEVRVDPPADIPAGEPAGEVVASLGEAGEGYAATLAGETLLTRFYGTAEFEAQLDSGAIVARAAPGRGEDMLPVFIAGNLLALVLGLRGAPVLHASAVELDGKAVAFAGPTGAGKSTLAALACAAGGTLVTDDAARIEADEDVRVHRGPAELRLRPQAAALAELTGADVRTTADARTALAVPPAAEPIVPLGSVVFPRWRRDDSPLAIDRLPVREALERLLACPRVIGWHASEPIRDHFEASAELAERVPAYVLELPKKRLADPDLPGELRALL